jgi:hypothetical protein
VPQLSTREAPNSAPSGGCDADAHVDIGGICAVCGEWLPVALCRDKNCTWEAALGERTLYAAVAHQSRTGHSVRVLIN